MDTKATLNVGACSRRGKTRGSQATQAWDHDMRPQETLVPFGMLEVLGGLLTIMFGTSRETSDLLADGLQQWWNLSKDRYQPMRPRVIALDNGPQNASCRTQCMHRMGECAERHTVEIVRVSSPPYPSKYTPIERCWGILEAHWNGTVLETVDTGLPWARPMTWTAVRPLVQLLDNAYANGVRVAKKAFQKIEERLERHVSLPQYCIRIQPQSG